MAQEKGLDDISRHILKGLAALRGPAACGDIAKKIAVPTSQVVCRMAPLRKRGLIENPEKGKYVITEAGAKEVR